MPRPRGLPTTTRSIRALETFWSDVEKHALSRGLSVNEVMVHYAKLGMSRGGFPGQHQVQLPDDDMVVRNPAPHAAAPSGPTGKVAQVQIGPVKWVPGKGLKK